MSGTEVKDEMDEMDYDEDDETEEEEALDEAEEDVKSMGSRMEKLFEISRRPLQGGILLFLINWLVSKYVFKKFVVNCWQKIFSWVYNTKASTPVHKNINTYVLYLMYI